MPEEPIGGAVGGAWCRIVMAVDKGSKLVVGGHEMVWGKWGAYILVMRGRYCAQDWSCSLDLGHIDRAGGNRLASQENGTGHV